MTSTVRTRQIRIHRTEAWTPVDAVDPSSPIEIEPRVTASPE